MVAVGILEEYAPLCKPVEVRGFSPTCPIHPIAWGACWSVISIIILGLFEDTIPPLSQIGGQSFRVSFEHALAQIVDLLNSQRCGGVGVHQHRLPDVVAVAFDNATNRQILHVNVCTDEGGALWRKLALRHRSHRRDSPRREPPRNCRRAGC